MLGGDDLADGAAGRMANEMRAVDTERVDESDRVVGHLLDRIPDPRVRAAPRAAVIVHDRPKAARELRHLRDEKRARAGQAGHEHEREALALLLVVDLGVTDRDG